MLQFAHIHMVHFMCFRVFPGYQLKYFHINPKNTPSSQATATGYRVMPVALLDYFHLCWCNQQQHIKTCDTDVASSIFSCQNDCSERNVTKINRKHHTCLMSIFMLSYSHAGFILYHFHLCWCNQPQ